MDDFVDDTMEHMAACRWKETERRLIVLDETVTAMAEFKSTAAKQMGLRLLKAVERVERAALHEAHVIRQSRDC